MVSFRDIVTGLKQLQMGDAPDVIVHASLSAFGEVKGGAEIVTGALMASYKTLVMPAFTYKTMLIPEEGPQDNGIVYGSGKDLNRMAEFFDPAMPVDTMMGAIAETVRTHPRSKRSGHPILSFTGIQADEILEAQKMSEPLSLIGELTNRQGWVLLLGVNHTVNTSIHYAEWLVGRKQFVRWALTHAGVVECQGFPGCSDGFEAAAPLLDGVSRKVKIGEAVVTALPLQPMMELITDLLEKDPSALLCSRPDCERCNAVRASI